MRKAINRFQCHLWFSNSKTQGGKPYRRIHIEPITGEKQSGIELEVYEGEGTSFYQNGVEIFDFNNRGEEVETDFRQFLALRDAEYEENRMHQALWQVAIQQDDKGFWQFAEKPKMLSGSIPVAPKPESPALTAFRRHLRTSSEPQ